MLIDLHAHTSGISHCCAIDAKEVIKTAFDYGLDGLAIANHYTSAYFSQNTYEEWIEKYIEEWKLCESIGKQQGIIIFKAIEVTLEYDPRIHILIYGADESFLIKYPMLCEKSIPELYEICEKNGCVLIQAHPFRNGTTVQDTKYLHGLEISCHPLYGNSFSKEIIDIAKKNGLVVTVGCDYHADTYRPFGGMFIPDKIKTDKELANYLLNENSFDFQIHDPLTQKIEKESYKISNKSF